MASTTACRPPGTCTANSNRLGLIQPVEFELKFGPAMSGRLTGFHAIDRERLAALPDADLVALHRSGWLEGAYLMLASLHNINRLAARKRARLAAGNWAGPTASATAGVARDPWTARGGPERSYAAPDHASA